MSEKPDIQDIATSYIIGDHIVEEVCSKPRLPRSKTGLPRTVAKDIQVKIMSTGKMHFALPREITGELRAKVQKRIKQSPVQELYQKYTYGALKDEVLMKATDESKPGVEILVKKPTDESKPGVEILADFIKEYSFTTKGKPPRDKQILLSIDTLRLHGKAIQELCEELLRHRNAMIRGEIKGRTKGQRSVVLALVDETSKLLEEYGEKLFRKGACEFLAKKGIEKPKKSNLNNLMVNVVSTCLPNVSINGLRKRLQRLRQSTK